MYVEMIDIVLSFVTIQEFSNNSSKEPYVTI
jgi:hypothetical protein